jgi:hypothetical protein
VPAAAQLDQKRLGNKITGGSQNTQGLDKATRPALAAIGRAAADFDTIWHNPYFNFAPCRCAVNMGSLWK